VTGAFDCFRQLPLVFGANTGLAAGTDLAFVRYIPSQDIYQLIVYDSVFICAESALTRAGEKPPAF
jgi:hypothetical protein